MSAPSNTPVTAVAWPWQLLLSLAYFAIPASVFGATPGKRMAGLCVVRVDGSPLTLQAVLVRNVLRIIDWLPFLYFVGGALVLFSANSQRLGDLAAGTTVVYRIDARDPGATRNSGLRTRRMAGIVLIAAVLFTVIFDYFGRPPLIIEGMVNTRQLLPGPVSSYTLSDPQWGFGTVTYRFTTRGANSRTCEGTITLLWEWLGWNQSGSGASCAS